jgi:pimeloyl-ACP methyl ester carboxylesterase
VAVTTIPIDIAPFRISIPQRDLDDLRERLALTRWPDEPERAGWDYGTNLEYIRSLVEYWHSTYDWRAHERALNSFHHFRAPIDGHVIHFIHERGAGPKPLPLVITHGWPSTVVEMQKIILPLADPASYGADPADAFDVVVPSLPGFGFSVSPARPGPIRVHDLWAKLMAGIGYSQFGAQGGDLGAGVTTALGRFHADRVIGMHISSDLPHPVPHPPDADLTAAEREYLRGYARWHEDEGAYSHLQRTRPQTLGYGLNDSPAALAAWIVEKFRAWSDCNGDIERRFSKDELLTNITIYWLTQTINSSNRAYFAKHHDPASTGPALGERVDVPGGVAMFPGEKDMVYPREWADRCYNVTHWTDMPRGGHFAAMEEPELLVADIREFFRPLRRSLH